ncbi:MAG: tetratricopeptide repeat protein [Oligoflexales bacterium]|nr:tetratricopeptide repeat protein [Oligoflexales bacterium]
MFKLLPVILINSLLWALTSCIHSRNENPQTHYKVSKDQLSFFIEHSDERTPLEPRQEAFLKKQKKLLLKSNWQAVNASSLAFLEEAPHDKHALAHVCLASYQLNKPELSKYYIDLLLNLDANNPIALNLKGLLTIQDAQILNDYRLALSLFAKAVESNPDEVAAGLNLGYTYLALGNASKAGKVFKKMTSRCNSCPVAQTGYAIALMRSGKHSDAIAIFEGLSIENPENLVAKYELARYHFRVSRNSTDANNILREVFEKTNINTRKEVLKRAKMLWKDQNKHDLF